MGGSDNYAYAAPATAASPPADPDIAAAAAAAASGAGRAAPAPAAAGGGGLKRTATVPSASLDEYCAERNQRVDGEIQLSLHMTVFSVATIDTVGQTFSCEFVLVAETLNAKGLTIFGSGEKISPDTWEPRIKFMNKLEETKWRLNAKMGRDGEVVYKYIVAGTFAETFELGNFPFDVQHLSIIVSSAIPMVSSDGSNSKIISSRTTPPATASSATTPARTLKPSNRRLVYFISDSS